MFFPLQIEYTIHRNNKGLGINIAGGKGSTPYMGNDEVREKIMFDHIRFSRLSFFLSLNFCFGAKYLVTFSDVAKFIICFVSCREFLSLKFQKMVLQGRTGYLKQATKSSR